MTMLNSSQSSLNNDLPIDHESQEFISWAFEQLDNTDTYNTLVTEALGRATAYYEQPREVVLKELKAKMHIGAVEHGAPTHTVDEVRHELANEYRDLMGWLLVEKWNTKKVE